MPKSERESAAGRVAILTRHHGSDHPSVAEARRTLAEVSLAEHIRKAVDGWPPLTPEQRDRLALLLRGGAA